MLTTREYPLDKHNKEHREYEHEDDPRKTQHILESKKQEDNNEYRNQGKDDPACIRVEKVSHCPGHASTI